MNAHAEQLSEARLRPIFIVSPTMWAVVLGAAVALGFALAPSLKMLLQIWFDNDDFGYGPMLPLVCGFLIWQQRDVIDRAQFRGSWWGVAVFATAAIVALIGQRAAVYALTQ